MISLTRLSGAPFALNPDLVERIDATPDTIITLIDGKKYVVAESLPAVARTIRTYRAEIIALSHVLDLAEESAAPAARPGAGTPPPGARAALSVVDGHADRADVAHTSEGGPR